MILTGAQKLEIVLGGAVTTSQLPWVANYYADRAGGGVARKVGHGTTNSATSVDVVAAPNSGDVTVIEYLSVRNSDTVNAIVTLRLDDGGTERIIASFDLATLERLEYVRGAGFACFTTAGARK